jgi:hypothetical protein
MYTADEVCEASTVVRGGEKFHNMRNCCGYMHCTKKTNVVVGDEKEDSYMYREALAAV